MDEHLVMQPIEEKKSNEDIKSHLDVPRDFTDLGAYVEISRSGKRDPFEMRRSREKDDRGDYVYNDPTIYFTLAMAMDIDPDQLTHRIDIEWMKKGGKWMAVKRSGIVHNGDARSVLPLLEQLPSKRPGRRARRDDEGSLRC